MSPTRLAPILEVRTDPLPGLVWGYRFDANGRPTRLSRSVDAMAIEEASSGTDWFWLHFALDDARTPTCIARLPLPKLASESLFERNAHVNLDLEGNAAWGVLADWQHSFEEEFSSTAQDVHSGDESRKLGLLHFALTDRLLVTARRDALRSVYELRCTLDAGACFEGAPFLLEAIIDAFAASATRATRRLAERLDDIEDRVLGEVIGDTRRELGDLRRHLVRLQRPLNALRRITAQFERSHRDEPHGLVDVASRLLQRFEDLDSDMLSLQDRARLLQEEVAARLSEQTNARLHVLSILSALFLPPTLVVGAFGMNMKAVPFADLDHGFALAMTVCAISSGLVYALLRWLGAR